MRILSTGLLKGLFIICLLVSFKSYSQTKKHIDTLKVGFYITAIRNIDFSNSSFNADIWVWLRYKNPKLYCQPSEAKVYPDCLEWINDITEQTNERDSTFVDNPNDALIWRTFKVNRKFRKKWKLSSYPFDIQELSIRLESSDFENKDLVLITDHAKIDSNFIKEEAEWKPFGKDAFESKVVTYQTSFGDPKNLNGDSKYSGVTYTFKIKREHRWTTFMKLFTGILISFLIAISVFLIKPTNLDARFGLLVGSLFSSIGSKYIVDSMIPVYYENTLFDSIHNLTFLFIFIITVISIISLNLYENDNLKSKKMSKKIDRIALYSCSVSYLVIMVIFLSNYMNK